MTQTDLLEPETGTDIVVAVEANPVMVLTDDKKFDEFYKRMKAETDKLVADVSTTKGRDEIRTMARKVVTTKTAIDKARLTLTGQWREQTNKVNAAGKVIEQQLEALAADVRRPLTEWEEAEKARETRCQDVIAYLREAAPVGYEETAADVRARLAQLTATKLDEAEFTGFYPQAMALRETAVEALTAAAERLDREEAERAELEKLRAEAVERQAANQKQEYAQKIIQHCRDCSNGIIGGQPQGFGILIRELEERVPLEKDGLGDLWPQVDEVRVEALARINEVMAQREEKRRKEAEESEAARIREAADRAAQAARDEEARKASHAEAAREAEHQAQLAAERDRREEAERIAREEQRRRANEEAEAARQAEEDRKRAENRAHRTRVQTGAKEAIMRCGVDEDTARKIVLAIIADEIPSVSMQF